MADFYADKGMCRYTMILPKEHKQKLEEVAKTYRISQGIVVEVLLNQMNLEQIGTHFEARQKAKKLTGAPKKAIIAQIKGMTADQLVAVQELIKQVKP